MWREWIPISQQWVSIIHLSLISVQIIMTLFMKNTIKLIIMEDCFNSFNNSLVIISGIGYTRKFNVKEVNQLC